tara:strand:- start:660 stop:1034 length:375 start_codon:yes stop_codon:yes gene_type:complete
MKNRNILIAALALGCYTPQSPDIYHTQVSCHWNQSLQGYIWVLQAWVYHPAPGGYITDVGAHLSDMDQSALLTLENQDGPYWESVYTENSTGLVCGRSYSVSFIAFDELSNSDAETFYYQQNNP